jgi:hypothetical protein
MLTGRDGERVDDGERRRAGGGPAEEAHAGAQADVARAVRQEPPGFSRNYLISRLAYRIQELAYGGLKPATRARLDALADALDPKAARKRVVNGPVVGTQLIREWRGTEHKVTVLADGFEWEGRRYKSLSAVARAITGTRWNGLTFFGVKRHGGGP